MRTQGSVVGSTGLVGGEAWASRERLTPEGPFLHLFILDAESLGP